MDNYFIRRTFLVIIKDKDGVTRVIKTKDFNKNELNLNLVKNEEELILLEQELKADVLYFKTIDEKFIQDILNGTDESILEKIFTRFISSVQGKNRFIKKLISITPNTGSTKPLIDAIDKYYSNVFDARYIEIGTYPFSDKETKDDMTIDNLKSIIFTFGNPDMKVSNTKVEYDPLQLKQNYGDKIMDFNEISKYPATIDIGLSDGIKTFNMMV